MMCFSSVAIEALMESAFASDEDSRYLFCLLRRMTSQQMKKMPKWQYRLLPQEVSVPDKFWSVESNIQSLWLRINKANGAETPYMWMRQCSCFGFAHRTLCTVWISARSSKWFMVPPAAPGRQVGRDATAFGRPGVVVKNSGSLPFAIKCLSAIFRLVSCSGF